MIESKQIKLMHLYDVRIENKKMSIYWATFHMCTQSQLMFGYIAYHCMSISREKGENIHSLNSFKMSQALMVLYFRKKSLEHTDDGVENDRTRIQGGPNKKILIVPVHIT